MARPMVGSTPAQRRLSRSSVTSVNDAPVGVSTTVTTSENVAYTFGAANFGFADPNDNPPNNFLAVKITTLPAVGIAQGQQCVGDGRAVGLRE